jgi:hypothetical protein
MMTNKTQNQLLTPLATKELIPLLDTTDNASTMAFTYLPPRVDTSA